jgi:ABC-type dipeptide/oligopeptide/nickel transport system permease component
VEGLERFANFFFLAVLLLATVYIYSKPGMLIKRATRSLASKEVTEERATDYLKTLQEAKRVPNYKEYWNSCKVGYQLVNSSEVSSELKEKVKQTMLSMGVSGI